MRKLLTEKAQKILCQQCKEKSPETSCYAYFKTYGKSISLSQCGEPLYVPDYCKFLEAKTKDNED
jgi:hypothetical protein